AGRRPGARPGGRSGDGPPGRRSYLLGELLAERLDLLLQGDHLELTAHDHLLELLEVEDLLLQLRFRGTQIAQHALICPHVAQDADRLDHAAVGVAQRGGVQAGRYDLAPGAAGVEPRVPRDAALYDLVQGGHELPRLLRADETREGLLEELVLPKTEQLRH